MEGTERSTLRAKYLDWCSARLAERFLDLSTEEIYALARPEEAGRPAESAVDPASPAADPANGDESPGAAPSSTFPRLPRPTEEGYRVLVQRVTEEGYRVLVQRVTEALLQRTSLPTFEQWAEAYAESPDRFDAELLGFWKDAAEEGERGTGSAGSDSPAAGTS